MIYLWRCSVWCVAILLPVASAGRMDSQHTSLPGSGNGMEIILDIYEKFGVLYLECS